VIHALGYVIYYVNSLLDHALLALGVTSYSFYVSLLSVLLNLGGNLLAVLVFRAGVAGLAVSTVLSAVAGTVIYLVLLRRAFAELKSEPISFRFRLSCVSRSMQYALPTAVQQLAFHGIAFLIAPSINALGAAATTGYNLSNRIYGMGTMCLWAATSAFACYTGQCIGEGEPRKIRRGIGVGFWMNVVLVLPFVLGISVFAEPLVSLFFPSGYTGDAYTYAVQYARVYLPFIYVQLVGHFLHAYLRSLGCVRTVLGITVVGGVIRWIGTLLLVPVLHIEGVFVAQILSWAVDGLISVALYFLRYRTDEHLTRVMQRVNTH
jgi:Na+-driven multidrug efflux pump